MIKSIKATLPNRLDTRGYPLEIELDLFNPYKTGLAVTSVTNTGPVKANTVIDDWATVAGGKKNTSHRSYRNIVMKLLYVGQTSIEKLRHLTYKYFPVDEEIRLEFFTDTGRFYIDGWIDDNSVPMWVKDEQSQISIMCEDPFFYAKDETSITFVKSIPQFHFFNASPIEKVIDPFMPSDRFTMLQTWETHTIKQQPQWVGRRVRPKYIVVNNPSNQYIGLKIFMTTTGTVVAPRFMNSTTNEKFELTGTFGDKESIIINTRPGHKSVTWGDGSNAINRMDVNSKWIRLQPGDNVVKYAAESGATSMDVSLAIRPLYEGI